MQKRMGRVLLSGAALLALLGTAQAADMATKIPLKAPPAPAQSWYGALRGRIGTTTGPALLYLTGGAAWVRLQDGVPPTSLAAIPGSLSGRTGTGWTWGGGTEDRARPTLVGEAGIALCQQRDEHALGFRAPATTMFAEFKERFVIVRFGLNYAFIEAKQIRSSPRKRGPSEKMKRLDSRFRGNERTCSQYFAAIGNCSAGNSEMMVWPLSVTTTSSSMRAAE